MKWWSLSSLVWPWCPCFPKRIENLNLANLRTVFTLHPREDVISEWCSHMASFLQDQALICICWRQSVVFSHSDFWGCNHFYERIMPDFENIDFQLCPLRTEISPKSWNTLMISCTIDDEIFKVLTIFCQNYSKVWRFFLLQTDEALSIFTSEKPLSLRRHWLLLANTGWTLDL